MSLPALAPLNEHADAGVIYFSGVASYTKSFKLPQGVSPGEPLLLTSAGWARCSRPASQSSGTSSRAPVILNPVDGIA